MRKDVKIILEKRRENPSYNCGWIFENTDGADVRQLSECGRVSDVAFRSEAASVKSGCADASHSNCERLREHEQFVRNTRRRCVTSFNDYVIVSL